MLQLAIKTSPRAEKDNISTSKRQMAGCNALHEVKNTGMLERIHKTETRKTASYSLTKSEIHNVDINTMNMWICFASAFHVGLGMFFKRRRLFIEK